VALESGRRERHTLRDVPDRLACDEGFIDHPSFLGICTLSRSSWEGKLSESYNLSWRDNREVGLRVNRDRSVTKFRDLGGGARLRLEKESSRAIYRPVYPNAPVTTQSRPDVDIFGLFFFTDSIRLIKRS
jgi:hypothetical protein